jgi:hypothetical protein
MEKGKLTDSDTMFMLRLARNALNSAVKREALPVPQDIPAAAKESCGCFITLKKRRNLRGCIGYIEGIKPLYEAIIDNAKNAALQDPRFSQVTPDELDDITVEVSVLTEPVAFAYTGAEDLLNKITVYEDGIILSKGYCQATFLPQVWEQLPDKVMFLEHLAQKAGLHRDDWKTAQYKKYQAVHFAEN